MWGFLLSEKVAAVGHRSRETFPSVWIPPVGMSVSPLLLRRVFPGYEFYWGGEVIELEGGGAPDSAALFDLVHHVVSLIGHLVVEDNDGFIANLIAGRARVDDVVSGYFDRGSWDLQNIALKGTGRIGVFGAHL